VYEFDSHDQYRFWEWQTRGQARYGMFDWGECAWTALDLLEQGIREWNDNRTVS
jgi:hypothetical protein